MAVAQAQLRSSLTVAVIKQHSSTHEKVASDSETEQERDFQSGAWRYTCCRHSPKEQGTGHRGMLACGVLRHQQVQHLVHRARPRA